jgi:hypothetical protein
MGVQDGEDLGVDRITMDGTTMDLRATKAET